MSANRRSAMADCQCDSSGMGTTLSGRDEKVGNNFPLAILFRPHGPEHSSSGSGLRESKPCRVEISVHVSARGLFKVGVFSSLTPLTVCSGGHMVGHRREDKSLR